MSVAHSSLTIALCTDPHLKTSDKSYGPPSTLHSISWVSICIYLVTVLFVTLMSYVTFKVKHVGGKSTFRPLADRESTPCLPERGSDGGGGVDGDDDRQRTVSSAASSVAWHSTGWSTVGWRSARGKGEN